MTTPGEGPASGYDAAGRPRGGGPHTRQGDGTRRAAIGLGAYLDRGWRVLPIHSVSRGVCSCGWLYCGAPGKHPMTQHGLKDASGDPEVVRNWWLRWPHANWAVRTGAPYGPVVIDVDRHGVDGFESLDDFEINLRREPLPSTLMASTGGGGRHLYFAPSDLQGRGAWLPGVDVKARNGYVLLPGSVHLSGRRYGWLNWEAWSSSPLPEVPEDVQGLLRGRRGRLNQRTGADTASDLPRTDWLREHGFRSGGRDHGFQALAWREVRLQYPNRAGVEQVVRDVWKRTDQSGHAYPLEAALAKVERAWADLGPVIEEQNAWTYGLTRRTR